MAKRNRASIKDALALAVGDDEAVAAPPVVEEVSAVVAEESDHGHTKTSTGYIRAGGEKIVRLTLHLTQSQKRNLKAQALQAGFDSPSAFLVEQLGL